MIRILHVLGALDRGGAETMVMNLYRKINRENVQFDFVIHTTKKCAYTDEIIRLGGQIYTVPRFKGTNIFNYIKAWKSFFEAHPEYHIVHGHMRSTASIYLGIAKQHGLYIIAHSHNTSSGNGISALVKDTLQFTLRYIADYYFACSEEAGEWLFGKRVVKSANFKVLANAIEVRKFQYNPRVREEVREQLGLNGKMVLGHVGRFHPQKNHNFLIQVFEEVHKIRPDSLLLLVGEGELKESVEKKVQQLSLSDSVIFLGERDDVHELLQAMDVFLFPSVYEGLGIVAIEAEAAGLKVICSQNIPKAVNIAREVYFLPLDLSLWKKEILLSDVYERKSNAELIVKAGYDIETTSVWLERFYVERYQR